MSVEKIVSHKKRHCQKKRPFKIWNSRDNKDRPPQEPVSYAHCPAIMGEPCRCKGRVSSVLSCIQLSVTPRTVAHQVPLSRGFPRQEYWSGLPFPSPGDLPDPGIEPTSLESSALTSRFFTTSIIWEAQGVSSPGTNSCQPRQSSSPPTELDWEGVNEKE